MAEWVSTGMPGLDELLGGGLRRGSCTLLEGIPGTGKTTVGLGFLYHGAGEAGEPGIAITFEQFPEQMIEDAAQFGWDIAALESQGQLRIMCTSPDVFLDQLSEVGGVVDRLVTEMGAQRILIDSASHLEQVTDDPRELRSLFYSMINGLKRAGLTTVVTKELGATDLVDIPFEEYLCDTVVRLDNRMVGDFRRRRFVEIVKSRGRAHRSGRHGFELTAAGPEVYPRYEPAPKQMAETCPVDRVSTGVAGIDRMLDGGLVAGSATLVAGSAGVGKTTLGLQFIHQGGEIGEPGVFVTFEESPVKLTCQAASFGIDLQGMRDQGLVSILHRFPISVRFEKLLLDIIDEIDRLGAKRLVFDSLTDLDLAFGTEDSVREAVHELVSVLDSRGVTAIVVTEVPELFGQTYVSSEHLSIIVDGIILMKYLELESEIQRAISVLKMRGSGHDTGIWRYVIEDRGIDVLGRFEGAEGLMAGAARTTAIALSVRSFSEFDEQLNAELLQRFSQMHPNVQPVSLEIPYNPDEALDTVRTALRADSTHLSVAPLCLYWTPEVVASGQLRVVDELLPPSEREQHMEEIVEPAMMDGELYAVPAISVCGTLLFRRDLLEKHGFDAPPATWDELVEQAAKITADEPGELIGFQFPAYLYEGLSSSFLTNLWSNGGSVVGEDGACRLDSPEALEALRFMHSLVHEHRLTPVSVTTYSGGLEPQEDFIEGRTVFLYMLPSVLQEINRPESPLQGKVGVAGPPHGPRGDRGYSFLGGWHFGIPVNARAPGAAGEFIRFMASPEVQKERAMRGGPAPTIQSLYRDPEVLAFNPHYPTLYELLTSGRKRHEIPSYLEVSRRMQRHLHPVLTGEATPEEALERLYPEVRDLVEQ
ncbi:MAG: extracellular solute-binding protein [Armatimonadota bacterium]|nr:extracellular solute-binding protein [Armatimonadota bacterium]